MQRDHREGQINKFVLDASLQAGAVTRCARHDGVLLHNGDDGAENSARLMATDWLKHVMLEEIREAIESILDGAAKDGCPECVRLKDS